MPSSQFEFEIDSQELSSIVTAALNGEIRPDANYLKQLALISQHKKNYSQAAALFSIVLATDPSVMTELDYAIWHRLIVAQNGYDLAVQILEHWHRRNPEFHWNIWPRHPDTPPADRKRDWFEEKQDEKIAEGLPSIFLNTMHKSGSMTLVSAFIDMFDLPTCRISLDGAMIDKVVPSWAEHFARGGALTQEHLPASNENLDRLEDAGVTKIAVHVRRPEQAIVSKAFHAEKQAAETENILFINAAAERASPENRQERLERDLEIDLPLRASWVGDWIRAREERDGLEIHISTYENLVEDPTLTIAEIVRFYGLPMRLNMIDLDQYKTERNHFRSGKTEEWRESFTTEQLKRAQDILHERIPANFLEAAGWAA
jgi:tetratricopeptide (TPR) repeat protein